MSHNLDLPRLTVNSKIESKVKSEERKKAGSWVYIICTVQFLQRVSHAKLQFGIIFTRDSIFISFRYNSMDQLACLSSFFNDNIGVGNHIPLDIHFPK